MLCACPVAASDHVGAARDLIRARTHRISSIRAAISTPLARNSRPGAPEIQDVLSQMGASARAAEWESWSPRENIDATVAAIAKGCSTVTPHRSTIQRRIVQPAEPGRHPPILLAPHTSFPNETAPVFAFFRTKTLAGVENHCPVNWPSGPGPASHCRQSAQSATLTLVTETPARAIFDASAPAFYSRAAPPVC